MASPYIPPSLGVGYNTTPPPDDGTTPEANRVKWATIKAKLADILKGDDALLDAAIDDAFGKILLNNVSSVTNYTVLTSDRGKLIEVTGTSTLTLLAAATAGNSFNLVAKNTGTGTVTVDGDGTETIDGQLTLTLLPGQSITLLTNGTNWRTVSESIDAGSDDQVLTMNGLGKQWETPIFGLASIQKFTTAGADTWVKPTGIKRVKAVAIGGGGGAGGVSSAASVGTGGAGGGETAISIIDVSDLSFSPSDVDTSGDKFDITGHPRKNDDKVQIVSGDPPNPLNVSTDYFIVGTVDGVSFQVANSKGGAALSLADQGTGTHIFELISIDMTVGAGGVAGASGGSGGGGGNTTFGTTYCQANGGNGSLVDVRNGTLGGTGGSGDLTIQGSDGSASANNAAGTTGDGGRAVSEYGAGCRAGQAGFGNAQAGRAPGGGGTGSASTSLAKVGAAGGDGGVIVEEYK